MTPLKSDPARAALLLSALGLAACSTLPAGIADSQCRQRFEALDARIDDAGVRDGGEHRVAGFAYLRVNRFLASFAAETADEQTFRVWVSHLRALDLRARVAELRNLGLDDAAGALATLDRCGAQLASEELASESARSLLRQRARVPDDYSLLARGFGLYPLAAPFLKMGINDYQEAVRAQYEKPLTELLASGPRVLWRAPPAPMPPGAAPWPGESRDALGIPRLDEGQWRRLAAAHAPGWVTESRGDYDRPGMPVLRDGAAAVDTARPTVHVLPSYTRFGERVLVQLNYIVWFSERPLAGFYDPYAGALDGVVWRVTLDEQGRPWVYDTIHACGCFHYYFPVQAMQPRTPLPYWQDPALLPQGAVAIPYPVVLLQSGTHAVERLADRAELSSVPVRDYELRPYSELLMLDRGDGTTRSLFAEDGLIEGSERGERVWLWPSGVSSPGAMRQWGRHATAFIGRAHFDDARALERVFVP